MPKRTTLERFLKKWDEDPDTGCWVWHAAINGRGYGNFYVEPGVWREAHRYAWMEFVGPVPDGLQLDHLCRNRACCNPVHLEPVTPRENLIRGEGFVGVQSRRTHCPLGHPYDAENTYSSPAQPNQRKCKECRRRVARERYRRRKAELGVTHDPVSDPSHCS